jgi:hypothetical protein
MGTRGWALGLFLGGALLCLVTGPVQGFLQPGCGAIQSGLLGGVGRGMGAVWALSGRGEGGEGLGKGPNDFRRPAPNGKRRKISRGGEPSQDPEKRLSLLTKKLNSILEVCPIEPCT